MRVFTSCKLAQWLQVTTQTHIPGTIMFKVIFNGNIYSNLNHENNTSFRNFQNIILVYYYVMSSIIKALFNLYFLSEYIYQNTIVIVLYISL